MSSYVVVAPLDVKGTGSAEMAYFVNPEAGLGDYRALEKEQKQSDNTIPIVIWVLGVLVISLVIFFLFYFQKVKELFLVKVLKRNPSSASNLTNKSPELSNLQF